MVASMEMGVITVMGLDVVIALHTQHDPAPDLWASYCAAQVKLKKKSGGDLSRVRNFVVTDGGAPNAKQRAAFGELTDGAAIKAVVVTNALTNPIKRGIATAVSWVNPKFRAVQPDRWRDALRHLDLEGQIQPILWELARLQGKLPPVSSLALLVAEVKRSSLEAELRT